MYPEQPCGGCHSIRTPQYYFVCGCINYHLYEAVYCDKCLLIAMYSVKNTTDTCTQCGQRLLEYEVTEIEKTR